MFKPELLSPAGDMNCLKTAIKFGADAVYVGGPLLQLRADKAAFAEEKLIEAVNYTHEHNKKLYVTVNSFTKNNEIEPLKDYAKMLYEIGADAVIVSDLGAVATIKKSAPDLDVHISTQANCCNYAAANAYYEMGASRVVLAREMTIEEIGELHAKIPKELELEAFVHGAMCMAYSGRCLISSFLNDRSGNRGECTQPCRWSYYLMERNRPNEFYKVEEYPDHTAILSSHDMKAVSFLDELKDAGIDSFKIEGRMKTEYYVAHVVNAYRRAIDKTAPMELIERELEAVSHRPYNSGFYYGNLVHNHFNDGLYHQDCTFAGVALEDSKNGKVLIEQRNFFKKGDQLELVTPLSLGTSFIVEGIETEDGEELETACHPQQILYISCGDTEVKCGDILRVRKENE
ncbi:MAG: U32 family peptidase [Clostridia bacterium]|nr:U32 family peptidase [Clostridia bacterium]